MCCGYCSYPPPIRRDSFGNPQKTALHLPSHFCPAEWPCCPPCSSWLVLGSAPSSPHQISPEQWRFVVVAVLKNFYFYFLNFKGMGKRGPRDIFFGDRKIINKTKNYKNWIKLPIKKRGDMTSEAIIRLLKIYLSLKNLEKSIKSKFFVILLKSLQFL